MSTLGKKFQLSLKTILCAILIAGLMMNHGIMLILAIEISSSKAVRVSPEMENSKNLLQNGDFSKKKAVAKGKWTGASADSWEAYIYPSPANTGGKIAVEDDKLVIESATNFRAVVHQTVQLDKTKRYKLSYRAENENKTGKKAYIRVQELERPKDDKSPFWSSEKVSSIENTNRYEMDYQPQYGGRVKFELTFDQGTGKVSFDDVFLEEVPENIPPKAGETTMKAPLPTTVETPDTTSNITSLPTTTVPRTTVQTTSASTTSSPLAPPVTGELLFNGDFEKILAKNGKWTGDAAERWTAYIFNNPSNTNGKIEIRDKALTMESPDNFRASVHQTVKIDKTKTYKLSYDLTSETRTDNTFIRIMENNKQIGHSAYVKGTVAKKRYEQTITPSGNFDEIKIEILYNGGSGKAIVDNVSLIAVDKITTTTFITTAQTSQTSPTVNKNLVVNGTFANTGQQKEKWTGQSANHWNVYVADKAMMPSIEVKNGELAMSSDTEFRGAVHQMVNINKDKRYRLEFDLSTEKKEGTAFVRIIEKGTGVPSQKDRLWYSDTVFGTTEKKHYSKFYEPEYDVKQVKIELFYEKGTGKAVFDNISLVEVSDKLPKGPFAVQPKVEENISLSLDKKYVFSVADYVYQTTNPAVAKVEGGILLPVAAGQTDVTVTDKNGQAISTIKVTVTSDAQDHYTRLLDKWSEIITGNASYNEADSDMKVLFDELEKRVGTHLHSMEQSVTKTAIWADIADYTQRSANLTTTYQRLEDVAKQITNERSVYFEKEEAIRKVKNSLEWLYLNAYNSDKEIGKGNWWDYEIGAPRSLVNTLGMLQDYFSQEEIMRYTGALEKFVPDPKYFRRTLSNPFEALGGNLVDMGRVKIVAGLLRKNDQEIADTVASMNTLFHLVKAGEGFYEDGSYIAHTNVAYTGAYGNVLIDGLSQLMPIIKETKSPLAEDQLKVVYHWIDYSFLPLIINGEMMDLSRGRSISRANSSAHAASVEALRGILRIADMSAPEIKQRLRSRIKSIVASDSYYTVYKNLKSYPDIRLMKELQKDTGVATDPPTTYLSAFNNMDKLAYYNAEKGFGFGLSMYSKRTQNYEAMNDENVRGWYTGDGMFYLYNSDLGHYSDGFWPTVDSYKMAGTTETNEVRQDATKALNNTNKSATGQVVLPSEFVGTLKLDDRYALAAMDFSNWNQTLSLRKGWAILNDKIVFIGSNIQNKSNHAVATTIDQRKDDSSTPYTVYVNGQAVNLTNQDQVFAGTKTVFLESTVADRNIGYIFFKPSDLQMSKVHRSGSWAAINKNPTQPTDTVANKFVTINQMHSQNGDSYAYMMVPNVNQAELQAMAESMSVRVLENSADLQVIYDESNRLWNIIKYTEGEKVVDSRFILTKAGLYTIKENGKNFQVLHYNPASMEQTKGAEQIKIVQKQVPMDAPTVTEKPTAQINTRTKATTQLTTITKVTTTSKSTTKMPTTSQATTVTKPTTKSSTKVTVTTKPSTKPKAPTTTKATTKPSTKSSTKATTKPSTKSSTKSTTKPSTKPTTKRTTKATTKNTTKPSVKTEAVYRLYHAGIKRHLYTKSAYEAKALSSRGWNFEGEKFRTVSQGTSPVYRLYHSGTREHLYTTSTNERDTLKTRSWRYEGIAWYSTGKKPIYRLYHAGLKVHLYTADANEKNTLSKRGWKYEGISFYVN